MQQKSPLQLRGLREVPTADKDLRGKILSSYLFPLHKLLIWLSSSHKLTQQWASTPSLKGVTIQSLLHLLLQLVIVYISDTRFLVTSLKNVGKHTNVSIVMHRSSSGRRSYLISRSCILHASTTQEAPTSLSTYFDTCWQWRYIHTWSSFHSLPPLSVLWPTNEVNTEQNDNSLTRCHSHLVSFTLQLMHTLYSWQYPLQDTLSTLQCTYRHVCIACESHAQHTLVWAN